jgi:hypothetical protein
MKTTILTGALLLSAAIPALADPSATPQPANRNVCLYSHEIFGWGSRDDHSLVVSDKFGRKYLVSVAGACNDLNWAFGVGIRSFGGGHTCVDRGDHIEMRGGGVMGPSVCWVTKVQSYTPEMQQADKAARANKQPLVDY